MASYKDFQRDLAPPWLQKAWGVKWLEAHGEQKDDLINLAIAAVKAFTDVETAPADALPFLASMRNFSRFPEELEGSLRDRILQAWDFWGKSGTRAGIELGLRWAGYNPSIVQHYKTEPAAWSEFSIYVAPFDPGFGTDRWSADGSLWGEDGTRWGFPLYATEPDRIRGLIRDLKPAHTKLRNLWYVPSYTDYWGTDDSTWGADGTTWAKGPIAAI